MNPTARATTTLMLASWLVFTQFTTRIHAQTSDAKCTDAFSWMTNDRGQSPCIMASYAGSGCAGAINIPALPPNQTYGWPVGATSTPCQCNTVTYTLISACAACQGGEWRPWPLWSLDCTATDIFVGVYPLPVPGATAFAAWAYLDPTKNNNQTFDVARAFAFDAGGFPDVSGTPTLSRSLSSTPVPSSSTTPPPSSTTSSAAETTTAASSGSNTNTDVPSIVGGTVGGVLGLGLIGVLVYFIYKHNQASKKSPSSVYMASRAGAGGGGGAPSFRSARSPPNGHVSPYTSPPFNPYNPRTANSPEVPSSPSPLLIGSGANLPPLVPVRHPRQYDSPGHSSTQYVPGSGHTRDLSSSTLSTNQHHRGHGGSISAVQQSMQYSSPYAASTHSSQRLEPNRLGSPMSRATGTATPEPYRGRPQI